MADEPTLYLQDLGVDGWVETLQLALTRADHHVVIDGAFGANTHAAVTAFQAERGLEVDGIVGNQTWAALLEKPPADPGIRNKPHGGLHHHAPHHPAGQAEHAGPAHTAPEHAAAPEDLAAPQRPAVTDRAPADPANDYAGTIYEEIWQHGYETGKAEPKVQFAPQPIYDDESNRAWLAGVHAGQREASGQPKRTPASSYEHDGYRAEEVHDPNDEGPVAGITRYRIFFPEMTLREYRLPMPGASLHITFGFTGGGVINIDPDHWNPVSLDQTGVRDQLLQTVGDMYSNLKINGIGGGLTSPGGGLGAISIGAEVGSPWSAAETRFIPPNGMLQVVEATPTHPLTVAGHTWTVTGIVSLYMLVQIEPYISPVPEEEEQAWYEQAWDWVGEHAGVIIVGLVASGAVVFTVVSAGAGAGVSAGVVEATAAATL